MVFCQLWRLPFYRCLFCFLWQEVEFRKRAFEAFKPYQLKQHVGIHTNEKPYNCEICQCKFRLIYHIYRHKRRKYCCNVEGKSFVDNEELIRQLLTNNAVRHKTMKCDISDYSTDGITSLSHHKKDTLHTWKTIWLYEMWKQISFTSTLSDTQQKQSESVSMLYLWKMFSGTVKYKAA